MRRRGRTTPAYDLFTVADNVPLVVDGRTVAEIPSTCHFVLMEL